MSFKERALVDLTEVINDKNNKLSTHSLSKLISLRKEIELKKDVKGLTISLKGLARICGIQLGDYDD